LLGLWDEPRGRHLYGVDHHQCRLGNEAVLLIAAKVYQSSRHPSTPGVDSWVGIHVDNIRSLVHRWDYWPIAKVTNHLEP
jgi:hypothetical protein